VVFVGAAGWSRLWQLTRHAAYERAQALTTSETAHGSSVGSDVCHTARCLLMAGRSRHWTRHTTCQWVHALVADAKTTGRRWAGWRGGCFACRAIIRAGVIVGGFGFARWVGAICAVGFVCQAAIMQAAPVRRDLRVSISRLRRAGRKLIPGASFWAAYLRRLKSRAGGPWLCGPFGGPSPVILGYTFRATTYERWTGSELVTEAVPLVVGAFRSRHGGGEGLQFSPAFSRRRAMKKSNRLSSGTCGA
jgi:hypothetical protein